MSHPTIRHFTLLLGCLGLALRRHRLALGRFRLALRALGIALRHAGGLGGVVGLLGSGGQANLVAL